MAYQYNADNVAFIRNNHPIVNQNYASTLLQNLGARSAVDQARIMARVDVDHVHNGSRYWLTGELIDAAQSYLSAKGAAQ